jgi:hypothetical protein
LDKKEDKPNDSTELDKKEDKPNDSTKLNKKEDKPKDSTKLDKKDDKPKDSSVLSFGLSSFSSVCWSTLLSFFGCTLISCKKGLKT